MAVSRADVTSRIISLAADQVGVDPSTVGLATHFVNDLAFDSLDMVDFTMHLEEAFEVAVPDDDAPNLQTVGQVVEYVAGRLEGGDVATAPR